MGCSLSQVHASVESKRMEIENKSKLSFASDHSKAAVSIETKDFKMTVNEKSPRIRLDVGESRKEYPIIGDSIRFEMSYCYLSQRGYYPNALGKANQDSYAICENFLGDKNTHLFGIFDGHGEYGDLCSHFAATAFPLHLADELKKGGGIRALEGSEADDIHTRSMISGNTSF